MTEYRLVDMKRARRPGPPPKKEEREMKTQVILLEKQSGYPNDSASLYAMPGRVVGGDIVGIYETREVPCDGMMWRGQKAEAVEKALAFIQTIMERCIVGIDPTKESAEEGASDARAD